jgi:glucose-1-phosphate thymidylyltransferase
MKGIVLAGGSGSRLFPLTTCVSKQLLPVYDKPTIYYPISTLMLSGIRDLLIISTPRDIPLIKSLLGDGHQFGVNFTYKIQEKPEGIAQAFILGDEFINREACALILGDNIFYGHDVTRQVMAAVQQKDGATVFAYHVNDPERYGVVDFDKNGRALSIEEKPKQPKSNWAVTGLYFYDAKVVEYAKSLKHSPRGELEITDLNRIYLENRALNVQLFGRGVAWLDTGTEEALLESSQFVHTIEKRQGLKIACLEEIALFKGYITLDQLRETAKSYPNSSYGEYVKKLSDRGLSGFCH